MKYRKSLIEEIYKHQEHKNIVDSPVWILKTDKVFIKGKYYLKTYLLIMNGIEEIKEVEFIFEYNSMTKYIKIHDFKRAESYPQDNVIGCAIETPENYNDEPYSLSLKSIVAGNSRIEIPTKILKLIPLETDQLENDKNMYLSKSLDKYVIFPSIQGKYWVCQCGYHNDYDVFKCPNCDSSFEDIQRLIKEGLEKTFLQRFKEEYPLVINPEITLGDNIKKYKDSISKYGISDDNFKLWFSEDLYISDYSVMKSYYDTRNTKNKKRRKNLRIMALLGGIVLILVALFKFSEFKEIDKQYAKAQELFNNSEFESAAIAFKELGNYSDADRKYFLSLYNRMMQGSLESENVLGVDVLLDATGEIVLGSDIRNGLIKYNYGNSYIYDDVFWPMILKGNWYTKDEITYFKFYDKDGKGWMEYNLPWEKYYSWRIYDHSIWMNYNDGTLSKRWLVINFINADTIEISDKIDNSSYTLYKK